MQDYKAQQAARASAAAALHASFPGLVPAGSNGLVAAAKNIRTELKVAFPGVKFKVTSSRFSGGDSIDVRWIDGPNSEQVQEIIGRYQAGSFDGMTDCYNYSRDAWTDAFGDAKYVHSSRDYSDKAILSAMRTARARGQISEGATLEAYRKGNLYGINAGGFDSEQSVIWGIACRRTWALTKKAPASELSEVNA